MGRKSEGSRRQSRRRASGHRFGWQRLLHERSLPDIHQGQVTFMKLDSLLRSREPWLHVLLAPESVACDALWSLERSSEKRTVCRVVRGHKATTKPAFFDECAAAWQF